MRRCGLVMGVLAIWLVVLGGGCTSEGDEPAEASQQVWLAPTGFDVEAIERDPAIAELVPTDIQAAGVLTVASNLGYPPMEMLDDDGVTPAGMGIDIAQAVANLMGLELQVNQFEFDEILPAIANHRSDIGVSSITVTPERLQIVMMVSYFVADSQLAAFAGLDDANEITSICGRQVAVQASTIHHDALKRISEQTCPIYPVTIHALSSQPEVTARTAAGEFEMMYADSPIVVAAINNSDGRLVPVGPIIDPAPYGVAIARDNPELAEAVQAALQHLISTGDLAAITASWGNTEGAITEAQIDPTVE